MVLLPCKIWLFLWIWSRKIPRRILVHITVNSRSRSDENVCSEALLLLLQNQSSVDGLILGESIRKGSKKVTGSVLTRGRLGHEVWFSVIYARSEVWYHKYRTVASKRAMRIKRSTIRSSGRYDWVLRDSSTRFSTSGFFHESTPYGPLIHTLKYFRIWFWIRQDIRIRR